MHALQIKGHGSTYWHATCRSKEMKNLCSSSASTSSSAAEPKNKRRKVKYETYKHWVSEYDHECQTARWLECEAETSAGKQYVTKLKCRICQRYNSSIICQRNYSEKWIEGAESVCTTNITLNGQLLCLLLLVSNGKLFSQIKTNKRACTPKSLDAHKGHGRIVAQARLSRGEERVW